MRPRVAIILVAWNHFETTTSRCLEAIAAFTDVPYRVDVVDNASGDGTADRVQAIAAHDPRIRLHRLDQNLGWAAATRVGLSRLQAGDSHVCLLNSDTQPTPRWLSKLLRHLRAHPGLTCIVPNEDPRTIEPRPTRPLAPPLVSPGSYVAPAPWPRRRVLRAAAECERAFRGRTEIAPPSAFCLVAARAHVPMLDHYLEDFESFRLGHRDWQAYLDANRLTSRVALDTFVYHQRGGSGGYYDYAIEREDE